ncbi:hypothetical protein EMIHUDRAFT_236246 [Emiliania huxleyi CCMP1516]|uniref:Uncharacterized protein n=2 Tax=Emiliania huxleyi TaxID=2903 RepID=A0A0D3JTW0_EMIH1|nr:hypothetical protein EMIHUDRAFT_236246 [Emiliania huxleyi CCMP1516]EOD26945.1 hypothetical protein EMIHUDRAFT_236246 [Emiliania huxleyi CCMP1516]|eukprot:XP_005779374.1 hypothetical protein EMIHUDRAFT_236246 [Emiliania huxleyi CCMP1516]
MRRPDGSMATGTVGGEGGLSLEEAQEAANQLVFFHTCRVVVYAGTNTLPLDSPVEVEAIITVKPA